ncbi:MAG: hypothetical protein KKE11_00460 [Gammaproteobacteria bacterium]|nr:hypothetical protein [Gammaproteobacteria bacterium]
MKNFLKAVTFVLTTIALIACSTSNNDSFARSQTAKERQSISVLRDKLLENNVRIFKYANSIALILPNKNFFIGDSANFTDNALEALDLIFILSGYDKGVTVSIMGYSSKNYQDQIGKALARERAHRVMKYLWRAGIHANFVYADGKKMIFSDKKDILNNCTLLEFKNFFD